MITTQANLFKMAFKPSALTIFFATFVGSTCFLPNGTIVPGWSSASVYQPCSQDASNPLSSICCATNRNNPSGGSIANGYTADICLPSGLCQNVLKVEDGTTVWSYWRDYCTQRDWSTGACLSVCTGGGQSSSDQTAEMTPCDGTVNSTKWCCGHNNTACCLLSTPTDVMTVPVSLAFHTSSSTSSSSISASTVSSSTASLVTSMTTKPSSSSTGAPGTENKGLSTGAKAGIGVGVGIGGALALVAIVFFVLSARRRSKRQEIGMPSELPQELIGTTTKYRHDRGMNEMEANEIPSELGTGREIRDREKVGLNTSNHAGRDERAELA